MIAFLAPGQGSQTPGMLADWLELPGAADQISRWSQISGLDLEWFWSRYLLRADIPTWRVGRRPEDGVERVEITWGDPAFPMPLEVAVNGEPRRVEMTDGRASFVVPTDTAVEVDPDGWVLATPLGE